MGNQQQQYNQERQERPRETIVPLVLQEADIEAIHALCKKGNLIFSDEEIRLICETQQIGIKSSLTLADFKKFLYVASTRNLNPLMNEIHIEYKFSTDTGYKPVTVTHIEGYRKVADMTGQYDGRDIVFGEDGGGTLVWAEAVIHRKDCPHPFAAKVYASEMLNAGYAHKKMPHVILGKDAEAAGLRAAYPKALAGLYIEEELQSPSMRYVTASEEQESETGAPEAAQPTNGKANGKTNGGAVNIGGYDIKTKPEAKPEPSQAAPAAAEAPKPAAPSLQDQLVTANKKLWDTTGLKAMAMYRALAGLNDWGPSQTSEDTTRIKGLCLKTEPQDMLRMLNTLLAALGAPEAIEKYKADPRSFGAALREGTKPEPEKPAAEPEKPAAAKPNGNGFDKTAKLTPFIAERLKWDKATAELGARIMLANDLSLDGLVSMLQQVGIELGVWPEPRIRNYLSVAVITRDAYKLVDLFRRLDGKLPLGQMIAVIERGVGASLSGTDVDPAKVEEQIAKLCSEGDKPGLF